VFEEGVRPEVFGRIPSQIEHVTWYGDYRRGLFLRSSRLWQLDLASGTSWPLPVGPIDSYFQLVE
jgi:hypothetical protein